MVIRMKVLVLSSCLTLAALSACTQHSAPEVAQYQNEQLRIAAHVEPGMFDSELRLFINNKVVIKQRSQAFGGSSQNFEGNWRGRPVLARATRVQNLLSAYTQIDVFISGTLVETLTV